MSKWISKAWEIPSIKVGPPSERHLRMLFSPEANEYKGATILFSYIPPGGVGAMHSHPDSDEIMYFTGRGEATLGDKHTTVEEDAVIVAHKGVPHEVRNTSDTDVLKIYCVFIPPVKGNPAYDQASGKTREATKGEK